MASKQELLDQLQALGVEADPSLHPATLKKMLIEAGGGDDGSGESEEDADLNEDTPDVPEKTPEPEPAPVKSSSIPKSDDGYMKITDVKALIAEAIAAAKAEGSGPVKVKRVTEYMAHVWRFDGKWVVDFKDRNEDPYVKDKIHAYQKWNDQRRQFEAWIEIVFDDGTSKDIPLTTYVKNRVLVYCPIIKRHQIDKSFSIGEVEKKKEEKDKLVGTGILVDQEVQQYEEVFEVKIAGGKVLKIPSYAIA